MGVHVRHTVYLPGKEANHTYTVNQSGTFTSVIALFLRLVVVHKDIPLADCTEPNGLSCTQLKCVR